MTPSFVDQHVATLRANHMMAALFDLVEVGGYCLLAAVSLKAMAGVMLVLWALRGRVVIT